MITPTTITSEDQIYLVNSPVNITIRNLSQSNSIKTVQLEIYVWSGNLNIPPSLPSYTLVSSKVSESDNYVNFQIAEILASHINKTKFSWIGGESEPSISGEGIFWQGKYQVTNENDIENPVESTTKFATLGYRYDYEHVGNILGASVHQPYLNLQPINYTRNYSPKIKYFKRQFYFSKTLSTCTSENFIISIENAVENTKCQLGEKYLIAYINRLGLWDYFTPYGKVVKNIKIDGDTNPRLYRNTNSINNNINHSKQKIIQSTDQSFTLNTGYLTEEMANQVEDVIFSPLIYLIEFTGEVYTNIQVGLTVDNTLVTVDSTIYTVDNDTVTSGDIGYFSKFKQIPVICDTKSFVKKTRLNDKGKINYDLDFQATVGRINQLK